MIGVCIILLLIALFAMIGYRQKRKSDARDGGKRRGKRTRPVGRKPVHYPFVYTIGIEGMTSQACALQIEESFHQWEGCFAVVDLGKQCAVVRTVQPVLDGELERIVRQAGYQAISLERSK